MKNSFQAPVVERSLVIATVKVPKAFEQATLPNLVTVASAAASAARFGPY